jgi:dUTP pyrophosphatase
MMLKGEDIRSGRLVSGHKYESQRQPAGFDLTVESVWEFQDGGAIDGDNSKRKLPSTRKLEWGKDGSLLLYPNCYKVVFNETVAVPADAAAMARPRSSLLRMGATVHTALWDPGYNGRSEALLQVLNPAGLTLYKDAKLVQLAFVRLEGGKAGQTYSGAYQGENLAKKP